MTWKKNSYKAKGFITLVYKNDFVEQRDYDCVSDRKRIIEGWQKRFKRQWQRCSLLINPQTDTLRINDDGTNVTWKHKKNILENQ